MLYLQHNKNSSIMSNEKINHLVLEHSDSCSHEEIPFWGGITKRSFCGLNKNKYLILLDAEFYLIEVPRCQDYLYSSCDFALELFKTIDSFKEVERNYSYFHKSIDINYLRELRENNFESENEFEVNFLYGNATKEYLIVREMPLIKKGFTDYLDRLEESYKSMREYLTEKNETSCLETLHDLFKLNDVYVNVSNAQVNLTLKSLQNLIINKIKNK